MSIGIFEINSREEQLFRRIVLEEWSDGGNFLANVQRYSSSKNTVTEATISREDITKENMVIGGCYLTNHPDEISQFSDKYIELQNIDLIILEDLVLKPEYRGEGRGSSFMESVLGFYLPRFGGLALKSTIIESHNFYKRAGGTVIFDGTAKGIEFKYGKNVLREGSVFLFS